MKKHIIISILALLPFLAQAQNMVAEPTPGKIKSEVKDASLGITTMTLSNGMKVILKPTDAEPGLVYFALLTPGGTSEYSNADYASAFNAPTVIRMAGVGKLDQKDLAQYLTGKKLSINPVLVNSYSVFNNRAMLADLPTALELTYAYVTAPHADAQAYKAAVDKTKETMKEPAHDAGRFFKDTVALIKANYNTRYLQGPLQQMEAVDVEKSVKIFKERFADAAACTAIFVGQLDVETLKPLLEKYMASLPATHQNKGVKDVGIYPPQGKIEKTFYKGNNTRAQVQLLYSGFCSYSKKAEYVEDFLQSELKSRLTVRLKAEDPQMYGPGVDISITRANAAYFTASLEFACTPEKVDALTAAITDELKKLEGPAPLQTDIEATKATMIKAMEENKKANSFWLAYLKKQAQYHESPDALNAYPAIINSITPQDIKQAAALYLGGKNVIRFVMRPEK